MLGGAANLLQILPCLRRGIRIVECDIVQTDDGVHRRADLMAHVGEESRLCPARLFRCGQRVAQRKLLRHVLSRLEVHIGKARADVVHRVVLPLSGMAHSGEPDHLIGFLIMPVDFIGIGDDPLGLQSLFDVFRLYELQELT